MYRYRQLKKQLKRCCTLDDTIDPEEEDIFFENLQDQLILINTYFRRESIQTVDAYIRITKGFQIGCFFVPLWNRGPKTKNYRLVADRAYWCRKYARANAVALRKILKKHDKICNNTRGRNFLQQCWCSTSEDGIGLFLHSPLLDELKAVQDVLQQKIEYEFDKNIELEHGEHAVSDVKALDDNIQKLRAGDGGMHEKSDEQGDTSNNGNLSNRLSILRQTIESNIDNTSHDHGSSIVSDSENSSNPLHPGATERSYGQARTSVSQSSDGLHGAVGVAARGTSFRSLTSPSLKAQRAEALAAIEELPHLQMLSSSDMDWAEWNLEDEQNPRNGRSNARGSKEEESGSKSGEGHLAAPNHFECKVPMGVDPDAPARISAQNHNENSATNIARSHGSPACSKILKAVNPLALESADEAKIEGSATLPEGGSSGVGPAAGPFQDEELRCPVCLDIMYKPVGLGCGHKFCKPCALEAAGFGRCCGSFQNIASYVPKRTPCPTCRQMNVYQSAVSLKEVGALIQKRFPELWRERKAAERSKLANFSYSTSRSSIRGASPFEILNTSTSVDRMITE